MVLHNRRELDLLFLKKGRPQFRKEPVFLTLALLLGDITMGGIAAGVGLQLLWKPANSDTSRQLDTETETEMP